MRRLIKDLSVTTVSNIGSTVVGAVTTVIAIRALSVEGWAAVAIVISIAPLLSLTLSLGTVTYRIRELARLAVPERGAAFAEFALRRLSVAVLLAILSVALVDLYAGLVTLCLGLAAARFYRGGSIALLSADRRFTAVAVITVGEKLLTLLLVAIQLDDMRLSTLPLAQLFAALVTGFLAHLVSGVALSTWSSNLTAALTPWRLWSGSGHFGMASLATAAQQADVTIVTAVAGSYQGGLFAAAARIPGTLNVLGGALAMVALPVIGNRGHLPPLTGRVRRTAAVGAGAVALALALVVATAGFWVPLLLGEDYAEATTTMQVYLVAMAFAIVNQPVVAVLQAVGHDAYAGRVVLAQVAASLSAQALGALTFGAVGAATGFLVASLGACIMLVRRLRVATPHPEETR